MMVEEILKILNKIYAKKLKKELELKNTKLVIEKNMIYI
jgi:hypothetical protein